MTSDSPRPSTDLPSLLILDCDGVLVDSEPLANRVFTEALNDVGYTISYEAVCSRFIGRTMDDCVQLIEDDWGRRLPTGFIDQLQSRTFDAFRSQLQPVRGVAAALDRVTIPQCVASSGELEKMQLTLGLTGLLARFEGKLFSATQVERGKPHPDLFLFAARQMHVAEARCVVVEDSAPGVAAGQAAGMRVLGYAPDAHGRATLGGSGVELFDDMDRLPELLNH